MFVLTNNKTTFLTLLIDAMYLRGVEFNTLNDDKLNTIENEKLSAAEVNMGSVFIGEVESDFNLEVDKKFIDFLKKNKFKRAVVAVPDSEKFNIEYLLNGSITVAHIPSLDVETGILREFYIQAFLELVLKDIPNLPCASKISTQLNSLIKKIAGTSATVLVNGPSGTGKELISNLIHYFSDRKEKALVAVNCAAIPEQMLESILFGHEKGAFTGAVQPNEGLVRAAHGGTILLDEISEMSLPLQSKLLRVIQEKKVMPIGSSVETEVDVRILATTNRNMFAAVKAGHFREDLFYRLNVFPINSTSLKDRPDDVVPIVAHMLIKVFEEQGRLIGITEESLLRLKEYDWPGNVRELSNIIQRAGILCDNNLIEEKDLFFDSEAHFGHPNTAEVLAAKFNSTNKSEVA